MKNKPIIINDPKLEFMKQKEWIFKQLNWIKHCYIGDALNNGSNIVLDLQKMNCTYLDPTGCVQTEYYYDGKGNNNKNTK